MKYKIFKHLKTGRLVKIEYDPFDIKGNGSISYVSEKNEGYSIFKYLEGACILQQIIASPQGSGLGTLLLSEVVSYMKCHFHTVSRVRAKQVNHPAKGFYLSLGFHPAWDLVEKNEAILALSSADMERYASRFFDARRGVVVYSADGHPIALDEFDNRIYAGLALPDWEVSTGLLLLIAQKKLQSWSLIESSQLNATSRNLA